MKIELKKISISERMSEETTAFTADIFVNGVKAGYAKNGGYGGPTDYHAYEGKRELIRQAEEFCKTLPPNVLKLEGEKNIVTPMDLETFIDNAVFEEEKRKAEAKIKKTFKRKESHSIMWGVPGANTYTEIKLPRPLSDYPLVALQKAVDTYKAKFKKGEVFLNTNLEALGAKL